MKIEKLVIENFAIAFKRLLLFSIPFPLGLLLFSSPAFAEELSIQNSGNGAGSENTVVIEIVRETKVESSSEANIKNEVKVEANTGGNTVAANVGDVSLGTGSIAVAVEINNEVNKAEVVVDNCCCGGCGSAVTVENSKNGANSQNSVSISVEKSTVVEDHKEANIQNSVVVGPNTGGNTLAGNVGGVSLKTGGIDVLVTIENKANGNKTDIHCGGPEEPTKPGEPEKPGDEGNGGPIEPEPEEPSEGGGEELSSPGEAAKPYESPRPGPTFDGGAILAAATELIGGQILPITGPCEWTYLLTLLLFFLAHSSRRFSCKYLYN